MTGSEWPGNFDTGAERHGRAWDAERCACGSLLVGCQGCCEMRCLVCDPYTDYERLNRCCTTTSGPDGATSSGAKPLPEAATSGRPGSNPEPYDREKDDQLDFREDEWETAEWDRTHGGSGGYSGGSEPEVSESRAYRVGWWLVLTLLAVNLGLSVAQSDWPRTFGFTVIAGLWVVLRDGLLIPKVES